MNVYNRATIYNRNTTRALLAKKLNYDIALIVMKYLPEQEINHSINLSRDQDFVVTYIFNDITIEIAKYISCDIKNHSILMHKNGNEMYTFLIFLISTGVTCYWDKPFDEKKVFYKTSTIYLERFDKYLEEFYKDALYHLEQYKLGTFTDSSL
jgi:hypothetical protein